MSRTFRKIKHTKFLRHPKTFPEIRDSEGMKAEGIYKRKKRGKRYLPSEWDDMPIAALKEKIK